MTEKGNSETIYPMVDFAGHCVCGNTTDPEIQTRSDLAHCHSGKVPTTVISTEKGTQDLVTTAYVMHRQGTLCPFPAWLYYALPPVHAIFRADHSPFTGFWCLHSKDQPPKDSLGQCPGTLPIKQLSMGRAMPRQQRSAPCSAHTVPDPSSAFCDELGAILPSDTLHLVTGEDTWSPREHCTLLLSGSESGLVDGHWGNSEVNN